MSFMSDISKWTGFQRGYLSSIHKVSNKQTVSKVPIDPSNYYVHVITLSNYLYQLAYNTAKAKQVSSKRFDSYVDYLLKNVYHSSCEFIKVENQIITVGVDFPQVDAKAIKHARQLLSTIDVFYDDCFFNLSEGKQIYE